MCSCDFFEPLQFGVACPLVSEKIIQGIRSCVQKHWGNEDFAVLKIDFLNAFNLVSRDALLHDCAVHFPGLLPWATWCYSSHPILWHPLGSLTSELGVQQGDPLGPLIFALVLHRIVQSIDADNDCLNILFQAWYLDDGVLAGKKSSVLRALMLIQEMGPKLGLHVNIAKCELFCKSNATTFPSELRISNMPHFEILGVPIGDYLISLRPNAMKLRSCYPNLNLLQVGTHK